MRLRENAVLLSLAAIWGASFLFIKIGLQDVSPATLVLGRLIFAVLTLLVIAAIRPVLIRGWWRFALLGVLVGVVNNFLPFMLITWGETRIASGVASIFNATTPLFTALLAHVWIGSAREPLTRRRSLGVLFGFLGVGLIIGPGLTTLVDGSINTLVGELAVLIAALSYGVGALLSRNFAGAAPLVPPLTMQASALIFTIPVALLWDPQTHAPSLASIGVMAELGILATAVAYLLYFWLIRHVGATRTSLVTYLLPCTALIYGAVFRGETVSWYALAGLGLVLVGTVITNGTLSGLFRRRRSARSAPARAAEIAPEGGTQAGGVPEEVGVGHGASRE
jgi:drug/metabolite transporter (DMT)-like permease